MLLISDKLPDSLVNGSKVLISTNPQMNERSQKNQKKFFWSVQAENRVLIECCKSLHLRLCDDGRKLRVLEILENSFQNLCWECEEKGRSRDVAGKLTCCYTKTRKARNSSTLTNAQFLKSFQRFKFGFEINIHAPEVLNLLQLIFQSL